MMYLFSERLRFCHVLFVDRDRFDMFVHVRNLRPGLIFECGCDLDDIERVETEILAELRIGLQRVVVGLVEETQDEHDTTFDHRIVVIHVRPTTRHSVDLRTQVRVGELDGSRMEREKTSIYGERWTCEGTRAEQKTRRRCQHRYEFDLKQGDEIGKDVLFAGVDHCRCESK